MKKLMVGLFLVAFLTGCTKLRLENYKQLKAGMDYDRVIEILGEATTCDEALGAKSCTWGDTNQHIKVKFVADNVAFYSKEGLE